MRTVARALQRFKTQTIRQSTARIVLYDIPTASGPMPWSPNVWRTRLALNFKKLPYETKWVEYPDIEHTAKQIGAKPTGLKPDGSGDLFWTCPMIVDPSHLDDKGNATVISDTKRIAKYLDEMYPEHELFPEGTIELQEEWADFVRSCITKPLANLMLPLYPSVLSPKSAKYIKTTREAWIGPLNDMSPDRPQAWQVVREALDKIARAFDERGIRAEENLRVIPGRTCYADFALLAPLLWVMALAPKEESDALRSWNRGRWDRLLNSHAGIIKNKEAVL